MINCSEDFLFLLIFLSSLHLKNFKKIKKNQKKKNKCCSNEIFI